MVTDETGTPVLIVEYTPAGIVVAWITKDGRYGGGLLPLETLPVPPGTPVTAELAAAYIYSQVTEQATPDGQPMPPSPSSKIYHTPTAAEYTFYCPPGSLGSTMMAISASQMTGAPSAAPAGRLHVATAIVNGAPRRRLLDEKGRDVIGKYFGSITNNGRCVLPACATHDKCYFEHRCNAVSWIFFVLPKLLSARAAALARLKPSKLASQGTAKPDVVHKGWLPSCCSLPSVGDVINGGKKVLKQLGDDLTTLSKDVGKIILRAEDAVAASAACGQCNRDVMWSILTGCSSINPKNWDTCFDSDRATGCHKYFDCSDSSVVNCQCKDEWPCTGSAQNECCVKSRQAYGTAGQTNLKACPLESASTCTSSDPAACDCCCCLPGNVCNAANRCVAV